MKNTNSQKDLKASNFTLTQMLVARPKKQASTKRAQRPIKYYKWPQTFQRRQEKYSLTNQPWSNKLSLKEN